MASKNFKPVHDEALRDSILRSMLGNAGAMGQYGLGGMLGEIGGAFGGQHGMQQQFQQTQGGQLRSMDWGAQQQAVPAEHRISRRAALESADWFRQNHGLATFEPKPETVQERDARFLREAMAELDLIAPEGTMPETRPDWWWVPRVVQASMLAVTLWIILLLLT